MRRDADYNITIVETVRTWLRRLEDKTAIKGHDRIVSVLTWF